MIVRGSKPDEQSLLSNASAALATYEQALEFLGVQRDTSDDFVTATVAVKV